MLKAICNWRDSGSYTLFEAFAKGLVKGSAEGAIIMYVPFLIGCFYWRHKALKK